MLPLKALGLHVLSCRVQAGSRGQRGQTLLLYRPDAQGETLRDRFLIVSLRQVVVERLLLQLEGEVLLLGLQGRGWG